MAAVRKHRNIQTIIQTYKHANSTHAHKHANMQHILGKCLPESFV
jgi:hypothetical protein